MLSAIEQGDPRAAVRLLTSWCFFAASWATSCPSSRIQWFASKAVALPRRGHGVGDGV